MIVKHPELITNLKEEIVITPIDNLDEVYSIDRKIYEDLKKEEDLYIFPYPLCNKLRKKDIFQYFDEIEPGVYIYEKYLSKKYVNISKEPKRIEEIIASKYEVISNILFYLGAKSIKIEFTSKSQNKFKGKSSIGGNIGFGFNSQAGTGSSKEETYFNNDTSFKVEEDFETYFYKKLSLMNFKEFKEKAFDIEKAFNLAHKTGLINDIYIKSLFNDIHQLKFLKRKVVEYNASQEIKNKLNSIFKFKLLLKGKDIADANLLTLIFGLDGQFISQLESFSNNNVILYINVEFF